jgi:hypothetical protein
MVFPVEEPDFETFCYDIETLTREAVDTVCQLFGSPVPDITLDVDAILAPLYVDTALAHAKYVRGE